MREHDIVLWGATGFTGSLVARYFAQRVSQRVPGLRWALAGRNKSKLEQLASEIGADVPVLVGDSTMPSDVERVAASTRVLLSTAGPYGIHGSPVVAACVKARTHYLDLNGETGWHREMIDQHDESAKANGTILVPSAGFDSVPSDLGVQWMANRIADSCDQPTRRISCFVAVRGQFSGGTIASGIVGEEKYGPEFLARPFLLGGANAHRDGFEHADIIDPAFDKLVNSYVAPFGMAPINTRIVRRSVGLMEASMPECAKQLYTSNFSYRELSLAPSEEAAVKMARASAAPVDKRKEMVAIGKLPTPGQGPDEVTRSKSWFKFTFIAESDDGSTKLAGECSGGDPGYDETAKMISEAAVCLADKSDGAGLGGFMTPATALGPQLRERLHAEGILFNPVSMPVA